MNALYRPGPMDYIPDFISGKNDPSKVHYDLPEMSGLLAETYGVTVYQEQVMLLSQSLAEIHDKLEGLKKTLSIIGAEVSALEMVVRSYPNPYSEGSEYKAMALRDAEEGKK